VGFVHGVGDWHWTPRWQCQSPTPCTNPP
jgi:hypothetical protein